MTNAVRELYEKASRLSESDRAELAGLLLETLQQPPDPGVEEAWAQEIGRRLAEYRAGLLRTIPWQEVRAELHRANR